MLFGIKENVNTGKHIDLIMLIAKFYVYKCKLQSPMPVLSVPQYLQGQIQYSVLIRLSAVS